MNEFKYQHFSDITAKEIVEIANKKCLKKDKSFQTQTPKNYEVSYSEIKTNQVRNIFSHINTIKNKFNKEKNWELLDTLLILTKPKLAYAVGRVESKQRYHYEDFQKLLDEAINKTIDTPSEKKENAYENFFALIEAIVAYHKFYGGKEK